MPSTDAVGPVRGQAVGPCAEMLSPQPVCSKRSWGLCFLSSPPLGGQATPKRPGGAFLRTIYTRRRLLSGRMNLATGCVWMTGTVLQQRQSTRRRRGPETCASQLSRGLSSGKSGLAKIHAAALSSLVLQAMGVLLPNMLEGPDERRAVNSKQTGLLGPLGVGLHRFGANV